MSNKMSNKTVSSKPHFISKIPLLGLPWIAYLILTALFGSPILEKNLFSLSVSSGGTLFLSIGGLLILCSLFLSFFETTKNNRPQARTKLNDLLSLGIFILAVLLFIFWKACATEVYLLLLVMMILDLLTSLSLRQYAKRILKNRVQEESYSSEENTTL